MAKTLFNAMILMAILQLSGPGTPAAAADVHMIEKTIPGTVQAAREQGVPDRILSDLLARAVDRGIDPDLVHALLGILMDIRRAGMPLDPFLGKIDEAMAKGVNPAQLEAGLRDRMADYRFVMQLLEIKYPSDRLPGQDTLAALVDCLDLGLSRETLADFLRRAPATSPAMLATAARNKAFLQQIGFDPKTSDELLRYGMTHRCLTAPWAGLFKVAAAAARKGISDKRFATAVVHVWKTRGDPHQVLQELGFTMRNIRRGPVPGPVPEAHPALPANDAIQHSTR